MKLKSKPLKIGPRTYERHPWRTSLKAGENLKQRNGVVKIVHMASGHQTLCWLVINNAKRVTTQRDEVTCKNCLRKLEKR